MSAAGLRLERRAAPGRLQWLAVAALTLLGSLVAGGLLFLAAGADPAKGFAALWAGAFGSGRALAETLVRATPLIFTGLACAVAFRARAWNIGAEGQLYAGAMLATWCSGWAALLPWPLGLAVVLAAGMAGGAAYAGLAGWLKVRAGVDEVIGTVILNYLILYALSMLLLNGPWTEAGSIYPQTARFDPDLTMPRLVERTRLHLGFPLAVLAAVAVHVLLARTALGLEIRGLGGNPRAMLFKGTDVKRLFVAVMALSGALAGLAGISEAFGIHERLKDGISGGVGYAGIIVAILARLQPLGVVPAAILFGGLANGALAMQIRTGVPSALAYAIQAIVLLTLLAAAELARYRLVRRHA